MTTQKFTSYDQVPWYRKIWFTVLFAVVFAPAYLAIAFTGDIYYQKKGELKTVEPARKYVVLGIFLFFILLRLINK